DVVFETGWEDAKTIVEGLQMPFRAVNPDVSTPDDEFTLAKTLAEPEPIDGAFEDISQYANAALSRPFDAAAWRVSVNDPSARDSAWDSTPFGLLMALGAADPAWRRALATGFLDTDGINPGDTYDYRISGLIPRADRDERRYDMHSVPRGTQMPSHFRFGQVQVYVDTPPMVEAEEATSTGLIALRHLIRFKRLRIMLPLARSRIVIDGSSSDPLSVTALNAGSAVAGFSTSLDQRTELDFGVPVDEVILEGEGAFVALVTMPIDPGLDPNELVEIERTIYGVTFDTTNPPAAPKAVTADNLGSAARANRRGHRDAHRGFEISWEAPDDLDPALRPWWPRDAGSAPPSEVSGYLLQRQWVGQSLAANAETNGQHVASRNSDPVSEALRPGADICAAFPPADRPGLASDAIHRAIEVFEDETGPDYGDEVTYQVQSVDVLGRVSAPAVAAPAQLQKHTRPPAPSGPPEPSAGTFPNDLPLLSQPNGVQIRLLQGNDPDLTAAERARVDAEGELVVLRWGWGREERELDPYVREFRVYERTGRLIAIEGEVTAAPTPLPDGSYSVPCTLSQAVNAGELAGQRLLLGDAFVIRAHGTGRTPSLTVAPVSEGVAQAPARVSFSTMRTTGAEGDPTYWDTRVRVVPRGADPTNAAEVEVYEVALPVAWIAVSPGSPRQYRSFGVSAADAESYIPDRRAAVESTPRPGNEGPVSGSEILARHRGRPSLAIADLADVTSITARRASADEVAVSFTPAAVVPAGADLRPRMRLERAPVSAILPRILVTDSTIALRSRDGTETPWTLSPEDQTALREGDAARALPDRFIAAAAAILADFDRDFLTVGPVDPNVAHEDFLPNTPGRWLYRLRALDEAGKVSAEAQVLAAMVRVPAPRRGTLPELISLSIDRDAATATVRIHDRSDGNAQVFAIHSNDTRVAVARADLATIRNRPDLDPTVAIVVRDDRGTRLSLTPVAPGSDGFADLDFPAPEGSHVHIWALSVSSDGVPSRLIGPLHAFNGIPMEVD
ncbi:MAG: hypothetical protein AAGA05_00820, partial [Pseudomonadota bacterium]